MEQSGKKKKIIAVVALCVLALAISGLVGYRCGKKKGDEANKDIARCVRFTDRTTGKVYDICERGPREVRIPYDGLEHMFSYEVLAEKDKKPLGKSGNLYYGHKEPGEYTYSIETSYNRYVRTITMIFIIEEPIKLQPEMKFEPNGAIDYIDGEYYKYKYTGFYCKPKAYAEYEGTRLDPVGEAFIRKCVPDDAPDTFFAAAPIEIGKYTVTFSIAHYKDDPDLKTYYSVQKTIIIEIVE